MKYLIDTHICLRSVAENQKISPHVKEILEDSKTEILLSQISLLEITIKFKTGKLPDFNISLIEFTDTLVKKGFTFLPLINEHLSAYFQCNFFSEQHRDPFDRCLIAIANFENAAIITKDEKFQLYKDILAIVW